MQPPIYFPSQELNFDESCCNIHTQRLFVPTGNKLCRKVAAQGATCKDGAAGPQHQLHTRDVPGGDPEHNSAEREVAEPRGRTTTRASRVTASHARRRDWESGVCEVEFSLDTPCTASVDKNLVHHKTDAAPTGLKICSM